MDAFGHATGTYDGHGFMAFGSAEGWDGYVSCDDQAYRDALNFNKKKESTAYDRQTVGAKYRKEFDLAGKAVVSAQAQLQQGHFDYGYPNYDDVFSDWDEKLFYLKWDHDVNDIFSYYLKGYAHTWWSDATFQNLDGSYLSDAAPWGYEEYGVNLITSTRFGGGHEVLAGIDFQDSGERTTSHLRISGEKMSWSSDSSPATGPTYLSPKTKLAVGGRYEQTDGTDAAIWDVSMKTPIVGPTYFRGVVNTSFTLPNIQQLYGTNPLTNRFGNPDLDPEKSLNVETGVGIVWRWINLDVGYFYRGIEDMIASVKLSDGSSTYKNTSGTTKIQGAEFSAILGRSGEVAAHQRHLGQRGRQGHRRSAGAVPKFYGKANLMYRHSSGRFGIDILTRYTGDIYERGLSNFDDVEYGDYYIVDRSVFRKLGKEKGHGWSCVWKTFSTRITRPAITAPPTPKGRHIIIILTDCRKTRSWNIHSPSNAPGGFLEEADCLFRERGGGAGRGPSSAGPDRSTGDCRPAYSRHAGA